MPRNLYIPQLCFLSDTLGIGQVRGEKSQSDTAQASHSARAAALRPQVHQRNRVAGQGPELCMKPVKQSPASAASAKLSKPSWFGGDPPPCVPWQVLLAGAEFSFSRLDPGGELSSGDPKVPRGAVDTILLTTGAKAAEIHPHPQLHKAGSEQIAEGDNLELNLLSLKQL